MVEAAQQPYLQWWFQGITAAVAFSALLLSAYGLYLQRRDKRPQLRVKAKYVTFFAGSRPTGDAYGVEVANTGHMPVYLANIYVRPGHGRKDKFGFPHGVEGPTLPYRLDSGQSGTWYLDYDTIREMLRRQGYRGRARITLIAADQLDNYHTQRTRFYVSAPWWKRVFGS